MSDISSMINVTSSHINSILNSRESTDTTGTTKRSSDGTFDGIFNAAVNMIEGTNNYLQAAQQAEVDYATGKLTSTHELAVIEQKANLSLQYTVAIKNQLLSAYKEIMNMQI